MVKLILPRIKVNASVRIILYEETIKDVEECLACKAIINQDVGTERVHLRILKKAKFAGMQTGAQNMYAGVYIYILKIAKQEFINLLYLVYLVDRTTLMSVSARKDTRRSTHR